MVHPRNKWLLSSMFILLSLSVDYAIHSAEQSFQLMKLPKEIVSLMIVQLPLSDLCNIKALSKDFMKHYGAIIKTAVQNNVTSYRHPACIFLDAVYRGNVDEVAKLLKTTKTIDRELRFVTCSMRMWDLPSIKADEIAQHTNNKLMIDLLAQHDIKESGVASYDKHYELIIASCRGDIEWFNKLRNNIIIDHLLESYSIQGNVVSSYDEDYKLVVANCCEDIGQFNQFINDNGFINRYRLNNSIIYWNTISLCTWAAIKNGDVPFLKNLSKYKEFNWHIRRYNSNRFLYGAVAGFSADRRNEIPGDEKAFPYPKDHICRALLVFKSDCFGVLDFDDDCKKLFDISGHLPSECVKRFKNSVEVIQEKPRKERELKLNLITAGAGVLTGLAVFLVERGVNWMFLG